MNNQHVNINYCVQVIISERKLNPEVIQKSKYLGVPLEFIDVSDIEPSHRRNFVSKRTLTILKKYDIDYLFLISDRILEGDLLTEYKNKIINFHPAILPSFKGVQAIDRALESKSFLLGITAHFIDDKIDEGIPLMMYVIHNSVFTEYYESLLNNIYIMFAQIVY